MTDSRERVRRFVLLLGWVSLFADMAYEGMRGALGPYLALLGASATAVGMVSGSGEAIGYALRYVTGVVADRTQRYWLLTIIGYATNLIAIPLLAFAGGWMSVAILVAVERLGKAIRSPAKTTITSFAASQLGAGRVFAVTEAMDQVGGMLGPLAVAGILAWRGQTLSGFAWAFALLAIPAVLSMLVLLRARRLVPVPHLLDPAPTGDAQRPLGPRYWLYLVGIAVIAVGLADWPLIAFHFQKAQILPIAWLPVAYAAAMAADGVTALVAGFAFDRARSRGGTGAGVVSLFVVAGAGYAPLVFLPEQHALAAAIVGIAMWSIARAATESIAKSMIATIVGPAQRGRAYGLYYLIWGVAWWGGSIAIGVLYDHGRAAAAWFTVGALLLGALIVALSARSGRALAPGQAGSAAAPASPETSPPAPR